MSAIDVKKLYEDYDGRAIIDTDFKPYGKKLRSVGYVLGSDGIYRLPSEIAGKDDDIPWIYVRPNPQINCGLWHSVMFTLFGIFPSPCLNCWKVVVRPRTLTELVALLELQEEHTDRHCKCGIEERMTVPALYGGYFYNWGKEAGLDCLDDVRDLVHNNISPDIPVYLKRYCTEYEIAFGPSDQIEETLQRGFYVDPDRGQVPIMAMSKMKIIEKQTNLLVDNAYDPAKDPDMQSKSMRQTVMSNWIKWAWKYDHAEAVKFLHGSELHNPAVIYERSGTVNPSTVEEVTIVQ